MILSLPFTGLLLRWTGCSARITTMSTRRLSAATGGGGVGGDGVLVGVAGQRTSWCWETPSWIRNCSSTAVGAGGGELPVVGNCAAGDRDVVGVALDADRVRRCASARSAARSCAAAAAAVGLSVGLAAVEEHLVGQQPDHEAALVDAWCEIVVREAVLLRRSPRPCAGRARRVSCSCWRRPSPSPPGSGSIGPMSVCGTMLSSSRPSCSASRSGRPRCRSGLPAGRALPPSRTLPMNAFCRSVWSSW